MKKVKIPATVRRNKDNPHNREYYGVVGSLTLFFYDEHGKLVAYDYNGHSECCYQYMLENTEPVKNGDVDFEKGMAMLESYADADDCWELEFRHRLNRDYAVSKWQEILV